MSRIGKRKITVPETVTIKQEGNCLLVKGPVGETTLTIPINLKVEIKAGELVVNCQDKSIKTKALQGTINSLITNMINGVIKPYEKNLEIVGVGYRFQLQGKQLIINAGFSHPVTVTIPSDLSVTAEGNTQILIKGIDKQRVGEFAAQIRKVKKPEPYKGKGIRYKDEQVRRKEGKKAAK